MRSKHVFHIKLYYIYQYIFTNIFNGGLTFKLKMDDKLKRESKNISQGGFSIQKYDDSIAQSESRKDFFMLLLVLGHWPLSVLVIPYGYGTQIFGLLFGSIVCLAALASYVFLKGTMLLKVINGQLLIVFSIIFIAEQLGRIEMHFHIFGVLAFLLLYRDWKPVVSAGTLVALHHVIFNYCQIYDVKIFGLPLMVFNYGYGLEIVFWHAFWVIFEVAILVYMGRETQQQMDFTRDLVETQTKESENALHTFFRVSDQGIFSFGRDLKISWGYSLECEDILGSHELEGQNIADIFYKNEKQREEFQEVIALIYDHSVEPKEALNLLDQELRIAMRDIALQYFYSEDTKKIICIMTDVTEEKSLNARLAKEQGVHERVLKIVSNNKFFGSFLSEAESLMRCLDDIIQGEEIILKSIEIHSLILRVHDFKANSGFFDFLETVENAHAFENYLIMNKDSKLSSSAEEFESQYIRLKKDFENDKSFVVEYVSQDLLKSFDALSVSHEHIVDIEKEFRDRYPEDQDFLHRLKSLSYIRAEEAFNRFGPMTHDLALKLGKKVEPLLVKGGEVLVPKEAFFSLASVLIHIIRNMVYHGIEAPDERLAKSKEESGRIDIEVKVEGGNGLLPCYCILFSDNGRGIDFDSVKKIAEDKGLLNGGEVNKQELIKLLFTTDISTASNADKISGRGAGLMSVHEEVTKLGGNIQVETKKGEGSIFLIRIPQKTLSSIPSAKEFVHG